MKTFIATISLCLLSLFHASEQQKFDDFCSKFVSDYKALNLPELDLSYVTGLERIGSAETLQKQLEFFKSIHAEINDPFMYTFPYWSACLPALSLLSSVKDKLSFI